MARFRLDNTEEYTEADLALLNARFDAAVAEARVFYDVDDWAAYDDHLATAVLAEFDLPPHRRVYNLPGEYKPT